MGITVADLIDIPATNPIRLLLGNVDGSKHIGIDNANGNSPFIAFVIRPVDTLNLCDSTFGPSDYNPVLIFTFNKGYREMPYYVHMDLQHGKVALPQDPRLLRNCEELLKFGQTVGPDGNIWILMDQTMSPGYFTHRYWKKALSVGLVLLIAVFVAWWQQLI